MFSFYTPSISEKQFQAYEAASKMDWENFNGSAKDLDAKINQGGAIAHRELHAMIEGPKTWMIIATALAGTTVLFLIAFLTPVHQVSSTAFKSVAPVIGSICGAFFLAFTVLGVAAAKKSYHAAHHQLTRDELTKLKEGFLNQVRQAHELLQQAENFYLQQATHNPYIDHLDGILKKNQHQ